jgi:integrase
VRLIKFEGHNEAAALKAEAAGAGELAAAYAQSRVRSDPAVITLRDVIVRYRGSPSGFLRLAPTTRNAWSRWLDRISDDLGDLPVKALKAKGPRRAFIAWRDGFASHPRKADYGMQVLKRVLSFGLDNELIDVNPAEGIEGIYRSNRADQIVEDHELAAILTCVPPRAALAIRLAAATGIRRGDLVRLKWSDVREDVIEFATSKSSGRTVAVVPLIDDARSVIAELKRHRDELIAADKVPSAYLLTTKHGGPWTKDAVTQAFIRGAKAAGVAGKHLHDLRGTAATKLFAMNYSADVVADILGWERDSVAAIKRRYVDRGTLVRTVVERHANAG